MSSRELHDLLSVVTFPGELEIDYDPHTLFRWLQKMRKKRLARLHKVACESPNTVFSANINEFVFDKFRKTMMCGARTLYVDALGHVIHRGLDKFTDSRQTRVITIFQDPEIRRLLRPLHVQWKAAGFMTSLSGQLNEAGQPYLFYTSKHAVAGRFADIIQELLHLQWAVPKPGVQRPAAGPIDEADIDEDATAARVAEMSKRLAVRLHELHAVLLCEAIDQKNDPVHPVRESRYVRQLVAFGLQRADVPAEVQLPFEQFEAIAREFGFVTADRRPLDSWQTLDQLVRDVRSWNYRPGPQGEEGEGWVASFVVPPEALVRIYPHLSATVRTVLHMPREARPAAEAPAPPAEPEAEAEAPAADEAPEDAPAAGTGEAPGDGEAPGAGDGEAAEGPDDFDEFFRGLHSEGPAAAAPAAPGAAPRFEVHPGVEGQYVIVRLKVKTRRYEVIRALRELLGNIKQDGWVATVGATWDSLEPFHRFFLAWAYNHAAAEIAAFEGNVVAMVDQFQAFLGSENAARLDEFLGQSAGVASSAHMAVVPVGLPGCGKSLFTKQLNALLTEWAARPPHENEGLYIPPTIAINKDDLNHRVASKIFPEAVVPGRPLTAAQLQDKRVRGEVHRWLTGSLRAIKTGATRPYAVILDAVNASAGARETWVSGLNPGALLILLFKQPPGGPAPATAASPLTSPPPPEMPAPASAPASAPADAPAATTATATTDEAAEAEAATPDAAPADRKRPDRRQDKRQDRRRRPAEAEKSVAAGPLSPFEELLVQRVAARQGHPTLPPDAAGQVIGELRAIIEPPTQGEMTKLEREALSRPAPAPVGHPHVQLLEVDATLPADSPGYRSQLERVAALICGPLGMAETVTTVGGPARHPVPQPRPALTLEQFQGRTGGTEGDLMQVLGLRAPHFAEFNSILYVSADPVSASVAGQWSASIRGLLRQAATLIQTAPSLADPTGACSPLPSPPPGPPSTPPRERRAFRDPIDTPPHPSPVPERAASAGPGTPTHPGTPVGQPRQVDVLFGDPHWLGRRLRSGLPPGEPLRPERPGEGVAQPPLGELVERIATYYDITKSLDSLHATTIFWNGGKPGPKTVDQVPEGVALPPGPRSPEEALHLVMEQSWANRTLTIRADRIYMDERAMCLGIVAITDEAGTQVPMPLAQRIKQHMTIGLARGVQPVYAGEMRHRVDEFLRRHPDCQADFRKQRLRAFVRPADPAAPAPEAPGAPAGATPADEEATVAPKRRNKTAERRQHAQDRQLEEADAVAHGHFVVLALEPALLLTARIRIHKKY
ncbi:hypothetical protein PAPYR_4138 [Paratrimastix pyriformis]|uniref:Uncharacterized protein n=1 Tax=Paratrimastix pyriformis TaxID=342808 RepID=A0ABQ8UKK4_9EUKA|nr:hypothetical protein PAPYR_4138 [Paratrimastix pyriformis]